MATHNFSQQHEDIKITKEEAEFLEKQFLKYLHNEMEKNSSNWQQFYDILNEETKTKPDEKAHTNTQNHCKSIINRL